MMDNLTYTLNDPEGNNHEFFYELDMDDLKEKYLDKNQTLWLHTRFATKNPLKDEVSKRDIARYR